MSRQTHLRVLACFLLACNNHHDQKKTWGEEGLFHCIRPGHGQYLRKLTAGTECYTLNVRTWSSNHGGMLLTDLFSSLLSGSITGL